MEEEIMGMMVGGLAIITLFIGLPWVILHYVTKWRQAKTLTDSDEKLLDELAPAKARFILMSPAPVEHKPPPLPDPEPQNKRLAVYRNKIKEIADARKLYFADLFTELSYRTGDMPDRTDNGQHLTEDGYRRTAPQFLHVLGLPSNEPYSEALEPLRRAVRKKNELYFHRWRPQNETYLFGFRKHEQGKNAREIAEFDPLVAAAEAEIEKLLKQKDISPQRHKGHKEDRN